MSVWLITARYARPVANPKELRDPPPMGPEKWIRSNLRLTRELELTKHPFHQRVPTICSLEAGAAARKESTSERPHGVQKSAARSPTGMVGAGCTCDVCEV